MKPHDDGRPGTAMNGGAKGCTKAWGCCADMACCGGAAMYGAAKGCKVAWGCCPNTDCCCGGMAMTFAAPEGFMLEAPEVFPVALGELPRELRLRSLLRLRLFLLLRSGLGLGLRLRLRSGLRLRLRLGLRGLMR